jgi:hypothetical protein
VAFEFRYAALENDQPGCDANFAIRYGASVDADKDVR